MTYIGKLCALVCLFVCFTTNMYRIEFPRPLFSRSAIAKLQGKSKDNVTSSSFVKRVIKGAFNIKPPMPRYSDIWDIDVLLRSLAEMHPPDSLSDYLLSAKTCALLSILSLSRASTVASLGPQLQVIEGEVILPITQLEKNSRPGVYCTKYLIYCTLYCMKRYT